MNHLHWTIAILCISTIFGTVPRVSSAENIVDLSKKSINEVNKAMKLHHKALNDLPWKKLQSSLVNLDRRKDEYSAAAGKIVIEIKSLMAKGVDAYSISSQRINEWCNFAVQRLNSYVKLFNDINLSNIQRQKELLIRVLERGIQKMVSAQKKLGESSASFNGAAGKLTALKSQFSTDFDSNSAYYKDQIYKRRLEGYGASAVFGPLAWAIAAGVIEGKLVPDLNAKLSQVGNFYADIDKIVASVAAGIDETKNRLQNEIGVIGKLKIATEETNTFVSIDYVAALRATLIESANNLIALCTQYSKRYENIFSK